MSVPGPSFDRRLEELARSGDMKQAVDEFLSLVIDLGDPDELTRRVRAFAARVSPDTHERTDFRRHFWSGIAAQATALDEGFLSVLLLYAPDAAPDLLYNPHASDRLLAEARRRLEHAFVARSDEDTDSVARAGTSVPLSRIMQGLEPFHLEGKRPLSPELKSALKSFVLDSREGVAARALRILLVNDAVSVQWIKDNIQADSDDDRSLLHVIAYNSRSAEMLTDLMGGIASWDPPLLHALAHNPVARQDTSLRLLLRAFGRIRSPSILVHLAKEAEGKELKDLVADAFKAGPAHASLVLEAASEDALTSLTHADLLPLLGSDNQRARQIAIDVLSRIHTEDAPSEPEPHRRGGR